jgi:hypothetical protein
MRLLLAISIVSFCALFCCVLAAVKQLRARRETARQAPAQKPLSEIFEAGEFRAPRSLRLIQNLHQQVTQTSLTKGRMNPSTVFPLPTLLKSAAPQQQPESVFVERPKAPQSVPLASLEQRADWALYNKDLGDLTDPYTQPLRSATANGTSRS